MNTFKNELSHGIKAHFIGLILIFCVRHSAITLKFVFHFNSLAQCASLTVPLAIHLWLIKIWDLLKLFKEILRRVKRDCIFRWLRVELITPNQVLLSSSITIVDLVLSYQVEQKLASLQFSFEGGVLKQSHSTGVDVVHFKVAAFHQSL